jgi:hypothetical protein
MVRVLFDRLMNHVRRLCDKERAVCANTAIAARPARDGADSATGRHPRERAQTANHWLKRPDRLSQAHHGPRP